MAELTVYASLYETAAPLVAGDGILIAGGRVRVRDDGTREIIADRLFPIERALGEWTQEAMLPLDLDRGGGEAAVGALRDFLRRWAVPAGGETPGVPLLVSLRRQGQEWLLRSESQRIRLTLAALRDLRQLPGAGAVALRCQLPAPPPRRENGFQRRPSP